MFWRLLLYNVIQYFMGGEDVYPSCCLEWDSDTTTKIEGYIKALSWRLLLGIYGPHYGISSGTGKDKVVSFSEDWSFISYAISK